MTTQKPNIIFLHAHNTGPYIEPYGYAVPTPHIRKLAEQGVLFRKAFAAAPTCSPSRASFLTGQCPHAAGMVGLAHRGFGLTYPERHLGRFLQTQGYYTALVGNEHTAKLQSSRTDPVGYSQVLTINDSAESANVTPPTLAFLKERAALSGKAENKPFFLSVGLNEAHRPYPPNDPKNHPAEDPRYCRPPGPVPDTAKTRLDFAQYKAGVRLMDNCWGAILKTLDETGLADNTLVFCFADHGIQFPRGMCNLTDNGLTVYLVARGPKTGPGAALTGGKVVDAMVSLMDLYPTLCQASQIPEPNWLEGKSLLPLVSDDSAKRVEKIHDELFGEVTFHASYEPMRSVRTDRYKFIKRYDNRTTIVQPNVDDGLSKEQLIELGWLEQPRHQEMLYDLAFDLHECNNLIDDPKMASVLKDLRGRLDGWMKKTNDPLLAGSYTPPSGTKYNDPNGKSWHEPTLTEP